MSNKAVAAVVLAAGCSTRFGQPKLLQPWGHGTVLDAVLEAVTDSACRQTLLVSGAYREETESVAARHQVPCCYNPSYRDGQSSSLKTGLAVLSALPDPPAALFVLADQPGLTASLVDSILDAYRKTSALIVRPRAADGRPANPVLFDPRLFAELQTLTGDTGGREIARLHLAQTAYVQVTDMHLLDDIDTQADYQRLRGKY